MRLFRRNRIRKDAEHRGIAGYDPELGYDPAWWKHLPTIEQSSVEKFGIFVDILDEPRYYSSPSIIGWWYSEDTYCSECGKDLPDIDPNGNPKTIIFDTGLEELLEGWSRTMSYVGCVACGKGADRWKHFTKP